MTALKIIGKPTAAAQAALEPHIARLYASPGASVMAIIEMRHVERLQPAPGSDKAASVGMKLVGCEIPGREQEGAVREAQRALYLQRTARGTLDDEGMLQLDEDTLKLTAGLLMSIECARLRAGLAHWTEYARRVVSASSKLSGTEIAHELQAVADGMAAVLSTAAVEEDS
jgi:hypothetical protein